MNYWANRFNNKVDWTRIHFFWGDERCVPVDDAGNSYGQTKKVLFDKINIPDENIHRILSELEPDSGCEGVCPHFDSFRRTAARMAAL